jgi:hypothetical protein
MPTTLRNLLRVAVLLLSLGVLLGACGDDEDEPSEAPASEAQSTSDTDAALDPAAVEASVQEFLDADEVAADLSTAVDCSEQATATVECSISGDNGLTGAVTATPSQGFEYTGEIEGPDGPSSLGGSTSEGSITDPASVEDSLNETLSDEAGGPTADCPDTPEGDSLECEVSGDDVTGTLTATAIGGFEWEGTIETPDGTRGISGNALP